jgi:hydroxymethylbilane synthase
LTNRLRIATRGSRLALWQAHAVADRLRAAGAETEIVVITTTGDRSQHGPVAGGDESKRQFVKELEDALLRGDADLAVHSAKDLPVVLPDGLTVATCLPREDPRDGLVLRDPSFHERAGLTLADALASLPRAASIGTGSVRRAAQLAPLIPASRFAPIRGNVDTRLAKLDAGGFDALVLACAGLRRLGFGDRISAPIPVDQCVPAPGQGIVAIEIRDDDGAARATLGPIHDASAGRALAAERALVAALGGGCQLPLGAFASEQDGTLVMEAIVTSLDGTRSARRSMSGRTSDPDELGRRLAAALDAEGARELLGEVRGRAPWLPPLGGSS